MLEVLSRLERVGDPYDGDDPDLDNQANGNNHKGREDMDVDELNEGQRVMNPLLWIYLAVHHVNLVNSSVT